MPSTSEPSVRIGVIFYSMTGTTIDLVEAAARGVEEVSGCRAEIRVVPELIPREKVEKNEMMREAADRKSEYPEAVPEDLAEMDGFLFSTPTRFGNMTSQMRNFFDRCGDIWQEGSSINKLAGVITASASVHGGQEVTALTVWPTLVHLGMLPVGIPYSEEALNDLVPEGGSPYAASAVSGHPPKPPTDREMMLARTLGHRVAELTLAMRLGMREIKRKQSASSGGSRVSPAGP